MQELIKKLEELRGKAISEFNLQDWSYISINQKLSEDFIREFQDRVIWFLISEYQELSEDFIREFHEELDWLLISKYQKLSEEFILEYQDYVFFGISDYWMNISQYQKLSENFIRENENKVCWKYIFKYQKLSENFRKEFQDYENIMFKKIEFSEELYGKIVDWDTFIKDRKN